VGKLTANDAEQARQLGFEAFGVPPTPPTQPPSVDQPGWAWFGAFDSDVLVARMVDREFDSWFGGVPLPTCGIAGLTVAAEYRGQGLLTPLFAETLRLAKERGANISGLFPSAAGIYRRFGYELIADYVAVEVRTQSLAALPRPQSVRTRRAGAADFDSVRGVYDTWARAERAAYQARNRLPGDCRAVHLQLHRGQPCGRRGGIGLRLRLLEPRSGLRQKRHDRGRRSTCDHS